MWGERFIWISWLSIWRLIYVDRQPKCMNFKYSFWSVENTILLNRIDCSSNIFDVIFTMDQLQTGSKYNRDNIIHPQEFSEKYHQFSKQPLIYDTRYIIKDKNPFVLTARLHLKVAASIKTLFFGINRTDVEAHKSWQDNLRKTRRQYENKLISNWKNTSPFSTIVGLLLYNIRRLKQYTIHLWLIELISRLQAY